MGGGHDDPVRPGVSIDLVDVVDGTGADFRRVPIRPDLVLLMLTILGLTATVVVAVITDLVIVEDGEPVGRAESRVGRHARRMVISCPFWRYFPGQRI